MRQNRPMAAFMSMISLINPVTKLIRKISLDKLKFFALGNVKIYLGIQSGISTELEIPFWRI